MSSLLPRIWSEPVILDEKDSGLSDADLLPVVPLNPKHLRRGLRANSGEFTTVISTVQHEFYAHQLESVESLSSEIGTTRLAKTVVEISNKLLRKFPHADPLWTGKWAQALLIQMWSARQRQLRDARDGKKLATNSSEGSSPWSDGLRVSGDLGAAHQNTLAKEKDPELVPQPLSIVKKTPTASIHQSILQLTLDRIKFSLKGFTAPPRKLLFDKEVMASARIILDDADSDLVTSYSFHRFIDEFEDLLNAGYDGKEVNLRHGQLVYKDSSGQQKQIQRQSHFEVAINHLINSQSGDTLDIVFYQESEQETSNSTFAETNQQKSAKPSPTKPPRISTPNSGRPEPVQLSPVTAHSKFSQQPNTRPDLSPTEFSQAQNASQPSSAVRRTIGNIRDVITPPRQLARPATSPRNTGPSSSKNAPSGLTKLFGVKPKQTPPQAAPRVLKADKFEDDRKRFATLFDVGKVDRYRRSETDYLYKDIAHAKTTDEDIADGDGDEQEEDEEPPTRDEYMVARLQGILNSTSMTHHTRNNMENWKECCEMFKINPSNTSIDNKVAIFGLKQPHTLNQYQAFAVWWQMKRSRICGGGFVADDPGLGKTFTFLAYIVVERQLICLWHEVDISRAKKDGEHLQLDEQHDNDICPSEERLNLCISCPCRKSSPTSKMAPKPGIRIVFAPESLVNHWKEEFEKFVITNNYDQNAPGGGLDMKLAVAAGLVPISSEGNIIDAKNSAIQGSLKSDRSLKPNSRKIWNEDKPKPGHDRWLVVTTAQYYKTWVKSFEYRSGEDVLGGSKRPGIVFGIAMIDECHQESQKGKAKSSILADLPKVGTPYVWGYSGTPFSSTPRPLEGVLWAIERHRPANITGWNLDNLDSQLDKYESIKLYNFTAFESLCHAFEQVHNDNQLDERDFINAADNIFTELEKFLQFFMLRRTAEMSWFSGPLLALKPHFHSDIWLEYQNNYPAQTAELINVVEQEKKQKLEYLKARWKADRPEYRTKHKEPVQLSHNTTFRVAWRLRIISTFPYLVNLAMVNHKNHLNLTAKEVAELSALKERTSPYFTHLKQIVESSPKAMWLHDFIMREIIGAPGKEQRDYNGRERKLVIITNFNPVALILKFFLEQYVRGAAGRVGAIYAGVKQRQRRDIIEGFTDAADENGNRKQKKDFKYLVGTTRFISTGLQLTRAFHVVLMEPDFEFSNELQSYARVHRIGQRNEKTYSYRLLNRSGGIEGSIMNRQALRNERPGIRDLDLEVPEDTEPMTPIQKAALDDHNTLLRKAGHEELQFQISQPSGAPRDPNNEDLHTDRDQDDDAEQLTSPDREYQHGPEAIPARRPKTRRRLSRNGAYSDSSSSSTSPPRLVGEKKAKNKEKLLIPRNPGRGSQPSSQNASRPASIAGAERGTRVTSQQGSSVPQKLVPSPQQPSEIVRSQSHGRGRPIVASNTSALSPTPRGRFPARSSSLQHSAENISPAPVPSSSHQAQFRPASGPTQPLPPAPLTLASSTPRAPPQKPRFFDRRKTPIQAQPSDENTATSDDGFDYQFSNLGSSSVSGSPPSSKGASIASSDALPRHSTPRIRPQSDILEYEPEVEAQADTRPQAQEVRRPLTPLHSNSAVGDGEYSNVQTPSLTPSRRMASSPASGGSVMTISARINEVSLGSPDRNSLGLVPPRNPRPLRRMRPMSTSNESAFQADREDYDDLLI